MFGLLFYSTKNDASVARFFVSVSSTYVLPLLPLLPDEPGERILLLIAPFPLVVVGIEVPRNVPVDLRRRIDCEEEKTVEVLESFDRARRKSHCAHAREKDETEAARAKRRLFVCHFPGVSTHLLRVASGKVRCDFKESLPLAVLELRSPPSLLLAPLHECKTQSTFVLNATTFFSKRKQKDKDPP